MIEAVEDRVRLRIAWPGEREDTGTVLPEEFLSKSRGGAKNCESRLQIRVAISQSVSCQFIFAVQTVSLEVVN
jgi:hypothetical protein